MSKKTLPVQIFDSRKFASFGVTPDKKEDTKENIDVAPILNQAALTIQVWYRKIQNDRELKEWRIMPEEISRNKPLKTQNSNDLTSDAPSPENLDKRNSVLDIEIQNTDLYIEQEFEKNVKDEKDIVEVGRSISILPDFEEI